MKKIFEDFNDEDIIEAIQAKYNHHINQAEKFKGMLDVYNKVNLKSMGEHVPLAGNLFPQLSIDSEQLSKSSTRKIGNKSRQTFESIILEIMNDGKPRLVSELINDYYQKTDIKLSSKDLSSKLSIRSQKGNIKNGKFINYPIEKRFWWGKSDWFDEGDFKPEYIKIVEEKYKNMA